MRVTLKVCALLTALCVLLPTSAAGQKKAGAGPGEPAELDAKIRRFAPTVVTADTSQLSAGDRRALAKVVEAARLFDPLFLRQVWSGNVALQRKLEADKTPLGRARLHYFMLNDGPWSQLDENIAFMPDVPHEKPATAAHYPDDMTKQEFESWVATLPEAEKQKATGFFYAVRRDAAGKLKLVPYREEYGEYLRPAAGLLREAAALTTNDTLRNFLTKRAAAFMSDDYYESDVAWMELDSPIDVTIGPYETPQWGANGWLVDLTEDLKSDSAYDVDDLLPPVRVALTNDDKQYAVPFYGESSILMYNKEVLDKAGVTMPDDPTWQQVSDAAKKVKTADVAGICMRGKPGWGDLFAPLTTVVQTFGGNWYDMSWNATVNTPEWKEAVTFYKTMLDESGEADPVSYSFNECLTALKEGKAAMWADASVAASMLEAADSPVKGKMGYAHMPVNKTAESGWLWSWNLAVPKSTKNQDAAVKFVKWATSKEYIKLVGEKIGWSNVPPGSRTSTYELPEYKEAAAAYAPITLDVMSGVNPAQPGVSPQPWVGIQYVSIPEFQDVGNQCAQLIADYIANRSSVDDALTKCQDIAAKGGEPHKS